MALLSTLGLAVPPVPPPPAHVAAARDRVDWEAAGAEAVEVLAGYLAVDTRNPPGNEARGAEVLAGVLESEGIASERVTLAPGRESLIARVSGSGAASPLCLLSHIDVAGVEPGNWKVDPFSGQLDPDGTLWGRGALDMKGMGVLELMTLVWLKRLDVPLERDVVLVAVADEELDNLGMRQLVGEHWDLLGCSHLINEGGFGARDALFEGQTLHSISVAEKGVLWVRMVATGKAGHGSTPVAGEAPARLLEAMEAIGRRKPRPRIDPALFGLLAAAGRHHGGFSGFVMRSPFLVRLLAKGRLMKNPLTRAAITDTVHLTGLSGGTEPNSVPSRASATYDCRLLPGTAPEDMLAELRHLTRKVEGIEFEVLHSVASTGSPWDDPLYEAIATYATEERPDAAAGPLLSVGFTDSIYARPLGVHAYGYVPFVVDGEELATMHGADERVSSENIREGLRRLFSIVVDFAGTP